MKKMRSVNQQKTCPSCGAPVVSEICAYCGTSTGLNTAEADMEYPVLECKAAILNFWTVWFPMIFGVAFGVPGLCVLVIAVAVFGEVSMLAVALPFLLISIGAFAVIFFSVSRYRKIKKHGKMIQATVYGYMDDSVLINNRPAQIVKLLVHTPNGPRFILYRLGNTLKPYGINDNINIMVYQKYFMICKNKEVVQW